MKRIVRGNDFKMIIPVRKIVDGEKVRFPLPACTDIEVNIVSAYRRYSLSYSIGVSDDSEIEARVDGDEIPLGAYALEVKGRIFGNDWRSNEYEQIQIVDNNASGDADMSISEGEDSILMDTAIIILPPSADTEAIISDAKEAAEKCRNATSEIMSNESARKEAEEARKNAESERKNDEIARNIAEDARNSSENSREDAENLRVSAEHERGAYEQKRDEAEKQRVKSESLRDLSETARVEAENIRKQREDARMSAEDAREKAEQKRQQDTANAVAHAESVDVSLENYELVVSIDE